MTLIDSYSRKQAIEDGVLIDVTDLAKQAGFVCNVCVTAGVWSFINEIPDMFKYQDVTGRLWDVLNVLLCRCRKCNNSFVKFKVHMPYEMTITEIDCPDRREIFEGIFLTSAASSGDNGELVITIQLPTED